MNKLYFIYNKDELLIKVEDGKVLIPNEDDIKSLSINLSNLDFLNSEDNRELLFAELHDITNISPPFQFSKLRSLIGQIDEITFNLGAKALHLISWNNTYKYCSKCGSLLKNKEDERAKFCPSCGFINYPKISPAIITAVTKDKKILLAHNANFIEKRYSVLAGFVEPGETFEDCVAREVFEETSIKVKNIKYFGSQPWPFPDSLMVAFICEYDSGEIKVDDVEITDASWYSADELPNIPFKGTIARKLIDHFVANCK